MIAVPAFFRRVAPILSLSLLAAASLNLTACGSGGTSSAASATAGAATDPSLLAVGDKTKPTLSRGQPGTGTETSPTSGSTSGNTSGSSSGSSSASANTGSKSTDSTSSNASTTVSAPTSTGTGISTNSGVTTGNIAGTSGNIISVGPTRAVKTIAQASQLAVNGDTVEIDAGTYVADVATWTQSNLVIRGVGGLVTIDAGGTSAQGKAIFVVQGDNVGVENIKFINCAVTDMNGAGIRHEGGRLVVRNSIFQNNQDGILTGNLATQSMEVYNSQFIHNGDGVGYAHNLYAGEIGKLVVEGSYFTQGNMGHLFKSRAQENYIYYNRFTDEPGQASYEMDLPNGGLAYVVGNIFEQGPNAVNRTIISFGEEGTGVWSANTLYFSFNTVVNDYAAGCQFINAASGTQVQVSNSLFSGATCAAPTTGTSSYVNSFLIDPSVFANAAGYDYRLGSSTGWSPALPTSNLGAVTLTPGKQYVHPAQTQDLLIAPTRPGAIQSQ